MEKTVGILAAAGLLLVVGLKSTGVRADLEWIQVGEAGFTAGEAWWPKLTLDGSGVPYVGYDD